MQIMLFQKTRDIIKAKKISLKKLGLGCKASASERLSPADEATLIDTKTIGPDTPTSLQFSLFYFFSKGFGLRGRNEHRQLCIGDVQLKSTGDGTEYLEMLERSSKTMDGSKKMIIGKQRQIFLQPTAVTVTLSLCSRFLSKNDLLRQIQQITHSTSPLFPKKE